MSSFPGHCFPRALKPVAGVQSALKGLTSRGGAPGEHGDPRAQSGRKEAGETGGFLAVACSPVWRVVGTGGAHTEGGVEFLGKTGRVGVPGLFTSWAPGLCPEEVWLSVSFVYFFQIYLFI